MKSRILIFHPALAPYRVDFFNALSRAFEAVFYFEHKNVLDQKFDQDKLKEQCEFTSNYLESGFEIGGRSFRKGVLSKIRKHKPDIILTSEFGPTSIFVLLYVKLFRRNTRFYTLNDDSITNAKERKGLRKFLRNEMTKNSSGVIFASKDVADWYYRNISKKTRTLELPIIHDEKALRKEYLDSLAKGNSNIKKYNLQNKIVVLFVGRLVEEKNLPFLLKCFSKIENKDCCLVIVGDGELKPHLKAMINELELDGKVILTGRKEEAALYNWYTFSHIFVLPSTYEPYGAVVNEALLGGCFILCSETAGASSLINEKNGVVFNPENATDFIEKLESAIDTCDALDSEVISLRNSRMPFSFEEKINVLIESL